MKKNDWKRTFAFFYGGQVFSIIGSSAVQFALIWWLTKETGSAVILSIAGMVGLFPQAVLGPFAGVVVDRFKRKTIMMAADTFIAAGSVVLMIYFTVATPPVWFVLAVLFLRAVGSVFHGPAMQAAIPLLVPPEALMKAGGWGQFIQSGSFMIGPALGAALMASVSMAGVIMVDVLGALMAVGILFFIKIAELPPNPHAPHVFREMKEALIVIKDNKPLIAVSIPVLLSALVFMPISSLYPLIVSSHFSGNAWHASVTEVVFAIGMMVSSLLIGLLGQMKRPFRMISAALLALGFVLIASGSLPTSGFVIFVVFCFVMGGTGNFFSVPYMAYIQRTVPPEALGRVISLVVSAMALASPLGLVIAGPAADAIGIATWFFFSGIAMTAVGVYCYFVTRKYDGLE